MYAIVLFLLGIGLFPKPFITAFSKPVDLFNHSNNSDATSVTKLTEALTMIGISAAIFILLAALIYFIRKKLTVHKPQTIDATWGCGYTGSAEKMQYTASSFIRAYRKLAEPLLSIRKKKKEITEIFPKTGGQETHPYDKAELWLIDYPLNLLKSFLNKFMFLQNGNLQFYILYGIVFISLVMGIPFIVEYLKSLIDFLNKL
jgi:hypothetical protein